MPPADTVAQAWTGHYDSHGEMEEADCVIGFAFGYRGKPDQRTPGLSNQDLANIALKDYDEFPKIFQFEIADAYREIQAPDYKDVFQLKKHRIKGKYLDTREVAYQAKQIMDKQGWKKAIILAHPYHVPRCDLVCQKLGIETIVTDHLRGAVEFDPQSTQKWTANLEAWRGYEPQALLYYSLKGWL